jgi:hypothetical protein
MRTEITEDDWKLARYATERSDELRAMCLMALRKKEYSEARAAGRIDGVRQTAADDMAGKEADRKLWQLILKHVPAGKKVPRGRIGEAIPQRRKEVYDELPKMVAAKFLVMEIEPYQGRKVEYYSRPGKQQKA